MTLFQLARSNISGLRRKYLAFLFGSVLAVSLFYLLVAFVLHPDVNSGFVAQESAVRNGLKVSQWILLSFTFFFVLYSSSAFIKARKKEFGLLCLLGATKKQVATIIVMEHILIGLLGIGIGLAVAIPASKVMLSGMAKALGVNSPIRFMPIIPAIWRAVIIFAPLHALIGAVTASQISPRHVVKLLREHQQPKALPHWSPLAAAVSVILIGSGYAIAWVVEGELLGLAMLPVTLAVTIGTFPLFSQVSVAILRSLQRNTSFYYKNLNLLTLGDLTFRMKENARVLATVAVLSAAVITATGTMYTGQATLLRGEEAYRPHALTFALRGDTDFDALAARIGDILAQEKVSLTDEIVLRGFVSPETRVMVIPKDDYNRWAGRHGRPPIELDRANAALLDPDCSAPDPSAPLVPMTVDVDGTAFDITADRWPFTRTNMLFGLDRLLIADTALYEEMEAEAPLDTRAAFFSYDFANWTKAEKANTRLSETIPENNIICYSSRLDTYSAYKQLTALTAMIAVTVASLFFISSGSMLYFRLFSQIQEDKEKYIAMRRLGVSKREINTLITRQVAVLFFAPIAVGVLHCGFAMKALSNLLREMNWPYASVFRYALVATAGFTAVQALYYIVAKTAYVKEVT